MIKKKSSSNQKEIKEWFQWAREKADWFDPLIDKEDSLLGPFKPELIEEKKGITELFQ